MFLLSGTVSFVLYGLLYLLVLSVVVVVHEYGHFIVGRWCGVTIEAFSLGFGPELFGWVDKRGTRWRLSAIPLGGYVRFAGDLNAASAPDPQALQRMSAAERSGTLQSKSVAQRAAIVAAGPIANFILSIVLLTGVYATMGHMSCSRSSAGSARTARPRPLDCRSAIGSTSSMARRSQASCRFCRSWRRARASMSRSRSIAKGRRSSSTSCRV